MSCVIVDGRIAIDHQPKMMPDQPDEFFLPADQTAGSVYFLIRQPRGAWTFELDVRAFGGKW